MQDSTEVVETTEPDPMDVVISATDRELLEAIALNTANIALNTARAAEVLEALGQALEGIAGMFGGNDGVPGLPGGGFFGS